jgi:membrane protein DedA with SNARE-associated domain
MAVYLVVALAVGIESLGVPIPGETALISAALLVSTHAIHASPVWIGISAAAGAIAGDSIGYAIGHKWGEPLFEWLGRKFPSHFGPDHVAFAERIFSRWGMLAVFVGRFIALLRIFAGPLSGSLKMPYPKFLVANAAGGICWAGGLTAAIYYLGEVADTWFSRFSYIALGVAVVGGLLVGLLIRNKMNKHIQQSNQATASTNTPDADAHGKEAERPAAKTVDPKDTEGTEVSGSRG